MVAALLGTVSVFLLASPDLCLPGRSLGGGLTLKVRGGVCGSGAWSTSSDPSSGPLTGRNMQTAGAGTQGQRVDQ